MSHTKTQQLLPKKILEAAYLLLLFRRNKKKMLEGFSWDKITAHDVRFLLRFIMYLFLAHCEQVYLFLAVALK